MVVDKTAFVGKQKTVKKAAKSNAKIMLTFLRSSYLVPYSKKSLPNKKRCTKLLNTN